MVLGLSGMHPLAQALILASTFTVSQVAQALTLVDDELSIGEGTPVDSYYVGPGAKLIAENATTEGIDVRAGGAWRWQVAR